MALSKQLVLVSITHDISKQAIEVKWENQVVDAGVVVAKTPHRTAYDMTAAPAFTGAIGANAVTYLAAIEAEIKGGALNLLAAEKSSHAATIAQLNVALAKLAAAGIP